MYLNVLMGNSSGRQHVNNATGMVYALSSRFLSHNVMGQVLDSRTGVRYSLPIDSLHWAEGFGSHSGSRANEIPL